MHYTFIIIIPSRYSSKLEEVFRYRF